MDFKVVIPARYASSRLPGKPLLEISGKPMIQHVFERGSESAAEEVVIATDDERIRERAEAFGARVCMTSADHCSGTERIAEVADKLNWADDVVVVNLQGDEPTMPSSLIQQVAEDMVSHPRAGVTTLYTPINEREDLFDPHVVKVVMDAEGYALLFSRAPIPWHRDEFMRGDKELPAGVLFARHIGLYAYRVGYLKQYVGWPPAPLEQAESLEQLRVLWHGGCIHVSKAVMTPGHGVDTGDDLLRVRAQLSESS
jgi:3-deoxy-manno-octulosonate cytidylyltransferase (CMP-KDO synthetase)